MILVSNSQKKRVKYYTFTRVFVVVVLGGYPRATISLYSAFIEADKEDVPSLSIFFVDVILCNFRVETCLICVSSGEAWGGAIVTTINVLRLEAARACELSTGTELTVRRSYGMIYHHVDTCPFLVSVKDYNAHPLIQRSLAPSKPFGPSSLKLAGS